MRAHRKRAGAWRVVPLCLLPLVLLTPSLAACSSSNDSPPSTTASSSSPSPSRLDPVISRVEGEADNIALYENSLVGLRIRFDAAAYTIYDEPLELPPEMRFADSAATIHLQGNMSNGSLWIVVIPTPKNRSPEDVADAYREAGVEIAKLLEESYGYEGLDLGAAKVVRRIRIGGLPATIVERRGTTELSETPVRVRSTALVGRRYTFLILLEVVANGFGEEFRSLDDVLDGISISDGDAA